MATRILSLVLVIMMIGSPQASIANDPCECVAACPPNGFTDCNNLWTLGPATAPANTFSIQVPSLGVVCDVEVQWCCRIRDANCPRLFTQPVTAICELAVTCIRIPKDCFPTAPVGQPLGAPARDELIEGLMKAMICANPCGMGLPADGQDPYEWQYTFPECWYWNKTGPTHWCLVPCSDNYCQQGFLMTQVNGQPKMIDHAAKVWSGGQNQDCEALGPGGVNVCTLHPCDEDFDPDCDHWVD